MLMSKARLIEEFLIAGVIALAQGSVQLLIERMRERRNKPKTTEESEEGKEWLRLQTRRSM